MIRKRNREEILEEIKRERNMALAGRSIYSGNNRDDWKKKLDSAEDFKTIIGLLHCGLDADTSGNLTYLDIVSTYFDYAHGYNNSDSFYDPNDREIDLHKVSVDVDGERQLANHKILKQLIAKKAFSVLCQKFLKDKNERNQFKKAYNQPSWWEFIISNEQIIERIIRFFSFSKNIPRSPNPNHTETIAIDFLYKFSTAAWRPLWTNEYYGIQNAPGILIRNRKNLMKILCNTGETDFLDKNLKFLSQEDVKTLKEFASSYESIEGKLSVEQALVEGKDIAEHYFLISEKIRISDIILPTQKEILEYADLA